MRGRSGPDLVDEGRNMAVMGVIGPTDRARQLDALAKSLGLTRRQRVFCEELAADPKRHQTRAAMAAGYSEQSAAEIATENLTKPQIKRYLEALEGPAELAHTEIAIAGVDEVKRSISRDMRYHGKDWRRREKAQDKMARIHGLYQEAEQGGTTLNVTLAMVLQQEPRLAAEVGRALLSGGPAKVVEGKRLA